MEKQTAIELLGGTPGKAAKAMGYKSPHAIYLWPDVLSEPVADRVRGVLSRTKRHRKAAHTTQEIKAA
jgi:hypothetical protein